MRRCEDLERPGKDELLLKSGGLKSATDWSSDGKFLLYHELTPKGYNLMALPLSGDRKPIPYLQTEFSERDGVFSPDVKWVAYQSDESGKDEVYIQPFPATGAKWQISSSGARNRDGGEMERSSTIWARTGR